MADVLSISKRYLTRSETVYRERIRWNEDNWLAYLGQQDFSDKADFQNRETTPGFPIAIEHIVGTFERALTDTDDWLDVSPPGVGKPFIAEGLIGKLLQFYMERLHVPGNHPETAYGIQVLVSDSIKRGLLEPVIIVKVYPVLVKRKLFKFKSSEPGREQGAFPQHEVATDPSKPVDSSVMRLAVELVPYEDYFPDPSPECRYEIHRSRRNLYDLVANPEYNQEAVKSLLGAANKQLDDRRNRAFSQAERSVPPDPYEVEVFEAWGDVIDHETGEVVHENVFWTWAQDRILREPTPNPFWDGTRPFVVAPLVRVPGSLVGKALADHAVPMWRAMNELVNLHLDSAGRGAWGVGQVRADIMESPEEVADGIPQGYSAVLKPNTPQGLKFWERVDEGQVSNVTLDGITRLDSFMQEALATPDTRLGQLPERATKATEIVQAMQSAGSLYESFAARYEDTFLEPLFEKAWKIILQYSPDFLEDEIIQILGPANALRLNDSRLSAQQRYRLLSGAHMRVRGLRGVATRERRFQKLMTLVNLLGTNPQFAESFGETRSYARLWDQLLQTIGVDPDMLSLEAEEEMAAEEAPPGSAGGQLAPELSAATGASAPNMLGPGAMAATPPAQAGGQTSFASNNPAANLAA